MINLKDLIEPIQKVAKHHGLFLNFIKIWNTNLMIKFLIL